MRATKVKAAAVVLAGMLAGCGPAVDWDGLVHEDDAEVGAAEVAELEQGERKASDGYYHYVPIVHEARWEPGCAAPAADCYEGLVVRYTKTYADLETAVRTSLNRRKKVLTVTLDTRSESKAHTKQAVHPEDLPLGRLKLETGVRYTVKVQSRSRRTLWTGTLTPVIAQ